MVLEWLFTKGRKPKVAQIPTEGKLFLVKPLEIDRTKFETPRNDKKQEQTRQFIMKALDKVSVQPEEYGDPYYTLVPKKRWSGPIAVMELKAYANSLGGHMGDWVEQALEWAQRICNGESWETICNNTDTFKWFRLVKWSPGYKCVGGSRFEGSKGSPSDVRSGICWRHDMIYYTVVFVVIKVKE